jgi:hypothetical protein
MTRDDITRMAREAGFDGDNGSLRRFAALVAAAERNKLAQWMIDRSYATGHGDTTEDLLKELEWQVADRCAEIADQAEPYQDADLIRKAFGVEK